MIIEISYKLLWSTIEDFVGLWELHWEVNLMRNNYLPSSSRILVKNIILYFLETDLVKLYYNVFGENQLKEINKQSAIEILEIEKYWLPPAFGDTCVVVGSTLKGEKYYNKNLLNEVALRDIDR